MIGPNTRQKTSIRTASLYVMRFALRTKRLREKGPTNGSTNQVQETFFNMWRHCDKTRRRIENSGPLVSEAKRGNGPWSIARFRVSTTYHRNTKFLRMYNWHENAFQETNHCRAMSPSQSEQKSILVPVAQRHILVPVENLVGLHQPRSPTRALGGLRGPVKA